MVSWSWTQAWKVRFCSILSLSLLILYNVSDVLQGLLFTHVDDCINTGNKTFEENVTNPLKHSFHISKHRDTSFKNVGLSTVQKPKYINVSQVDYRNSLEIEDISENCHNQIFHLLNNLETHQLQCIIVQVNWIATQNQPNISFDVLDLSVLMNKESTASDLLKAKKLFKKTNLNKVNLLYPYITDINAIMERSQLKTKCEEINTSKYSKWYRKQKTFL